MTSDPLVRIGHRGALEPLLARICSDYGLGNPRGFAMVPFGYQDCNLVLTTSEGRFFVKIFSSTRAHEEVQRYIEIVAAALAAGVRHPALYRSDQGSLHEIESAGASQRVAVFEYLEGENLFESREEPEVEELLFIAEQAARISRIELRPRPIYDRWACANFLPEYVDKAELIEADDRALIEPLFREFQRIDISTLPHCLVHGDLVATNILRTQKRQIYVLDFAVAGFYPRVQELAVLFCDLFFSEKQGLHFRDLRERALKIYLQNSALNLEELAILPLYTRVAHAMQIICGTYEKKRKGNSSTENARWIHRGRTGLRLEPL